MGSGYRGRFGVSDVGAFNKQSDINAKVNAAVKGKIMDCNF